MAPEKKDDKPAEKPAEKVLTLKELIDDVKKFGADDNTVLTKVRVDFRAKGVKLRYDHPAPKES